jgi:hypothetical protein
MILFFPPGGHPHVPSVSLISGRSISTSGCSPRGVITERHASLSDKLVSALAADTRPSESGACSIWSNSAYVTAGNTEVSKKFLTKWHLSETEYAVLLGLTWMYFLD